MLESDPIPEEDQERKESPRRRDDVREEPRRAGPPDRSPLRPRSPPGPPPPREGDRGHWSGPILAYRKRQEERPPIERRPHLQPEDKPTNKGVKKRKQQKRFKQNRKRIAAKRWR